MTKRTYRNGSDSPMDMKRKLLLVFTIITIVSLFKFFSATSSLEVSTPHFSSYHQSTDSPQFGEKISPILKENEEDVSNNAENNQENALEQDKEEEGDANDNDNDNGDDNLDENLDDNAGVEAENNENNEEEEDEEGEVEEDLLQVGIQNKQVEENKPQPDNVDPHIKMEKAEADKEIKEEKAEVIYNNNNNNENKENNVDHGKPPALQFHPANEGDNDADNDEKEVENNENEGENNEGEEDDEDVNANVNANEEEVLNDQGTSKTLQESSGIESNNSTIESSNVIAQSKGEDQLNEGDDPKGEEAEEKNEPEGDEIGLIQGNKQPALNDEEGGEEEGAINGDENNQQSKETLVSTQKDEPNKTKFGMNAEEKEEEAVFEKRRIVDDDGENAGMNRVFVHKEIVEGKQEWFISLLYQGRVGPPTALKSDAECIINKTHRFKAKYRGDPVDYSHLLTCPLPESLRFVRPLSFDIIGPNTTKKKLNNTLYSPPPPEKPLFNLGAFIRISSSEFPYINEWIEWQLMMGVEHIWVYDNSPRLNAKDYLMSYIKSGLITVIPWSPFDGWAQQMLAEMHMIYRYGKHYTKWLLMSDGDEFMYPIKANSYLPILEAEEKAAILRGEDFVSLRVKCMIFNSVPRLDSELSLVTSKFLWHNDSVVMRGREKNFILPEKVVFFAVHVVHEPLHKTISLDWKNVMRMNHYWGRDVGRRPEFPNCTRTYDPEIVSRFTPILKQRLLDRFGKLPILPTEYTGQIETEHEDIPPPTQFD